MAQRVKKTYDKSRSKSAAAASTEASNDNLLWMVGFVMLIVGLFSVVSVVSHYIHWSSDLSALRNDPELSGVEVPFENICSSAGAMVAYWVVDQSFGVFGIVIPIVVTILGWRIFRRKPLHINHFALSAALVLIMGSLTMGLLVSRVHIPFDLGGSFGQACATDLTEIVGMFGALLVLLTGWILTGVFINRNFRSIVDGIGEGVEKQGDRMKQVVEDVIAHRRAEQESDEQTEQEQERPVEQPSVLEEPIAAKVEQQPEPERVVRPEPQRAEPQRVEPREAKVESGEQRPMTMNEYLASRREEERRQAAFAKDEPEFYIEKPAEQEPLPMQKAEPEIDLSQLDEEGFVVMPSAGAKPNEIDVEALMEREQNERRERFERSLDEQGFAVVESNEPIELKPQPKAAEPMPRAAERSYGQDGDEIVVMPAAGAVAQAERVADVRGGVPETEEDHIVVTVRENEVRQVAEQDIDMELYDPLRDLESYKKPYVSLLEDYRSPHKVSDAEIYDNKCRIQETLKYFGIPIVDIQATVGPTVTLYEIVQAQGVKISKVQGLEKDIAQSLRAQGIRIIAPIPGRGTIGIEVPNRDKQIVSMYSAICSEEFQRAKMELPVVIGRTIQNENFTFDLAKMPHLLVAGATGQGKSVGLNAIITSLLYSKHPAQLKFVMIDPKMVEFSVYNKLERHFLAKMESEDEAIVTDPKKAVYVLNSLVEEMGQRLELCKMATARNIVEYNEKFTARRLNPKKGHRFLPYIVVIVDEFADLIMTAKEVEVPVMRLAQKARAVGIHLIIATQRPDVRVITGGIKANFPSRIAFRVIQMIDSRTIIDQPGANQLIGRGDMLFSKDGELTRIQCALVETKEVERLVDYISKQQGYMEAYPLPDYTPESGGDVGGGADVDSGAPVKYDSLFGEVARAAVTNGAISTSSIQRNYEVGFNRAGRIMLQLERAGIVGPQVGAKPREIKFYDLPSLEAKLQDLGVF